MEKVRELTLCISNISRRRSAYMKSQFKVIHHNYSFSELHTIDYIGKHEKANVTRISNHLGITRGAISKVVKRLQQNKHINSYQLDSNRKEIYFQLTESGKSIFDEHKRIHDEFTKLDSEYFNSIDPNLLKEITNALTGFDNFLINNATAFTLEKP